MACSHSGFVNADYKDDIGYTQLAAELGSGMPDGNIGIITQAEAPYSYVDHDNNQTTAELPVYLPNRNSAFFSNDSISDMSGYESGTFSSHATSVGDILYGSSSIASGANIVHAYWSDHWLQPGFLNLGSSSKPLSSSSRLGNHSWTGNTSDPAIAPELLKRLDWVIATDEFLQIVGVKNSITTNDTLLSAAYNVLAVGKTDGINSTGSPTIDSTYPSGRTRTEIVAPLSNSSSATPAVAATAALLIDAGHSNPGLSTDTTETSTKNRNNDIIYNAERSEVIKAALLAGADRITQNTSTTANITDYRAAVSNQSDNGLDTRFGAGQVNVYNSYHIIAAGEQNSSQDGGAGSTGMNTFGFDYDPAFGGANSSNTVASYSFSTGTGPAILSASLVWHIDIDGGTGLSFSGAATFYDLDLNIYDVTNSQTLLVDSNSTINNSENIWTALSANRDYLLQVIPKSGKSTFEWDYALAWQLVSDLDGDGIADHQDNCPVNSNTSQTDTNKDGIGDDCDIDNDGVADVDDNCPVDVNINQADSDNDGAGDVCDVFPEDSGETLDSDDDGVGDNADAFPLDSSEIIDTDNDGTGNNADTDDDNDGVLDQDDAFPLDSTESIDSDKDGTGDAADTDDDNDGVLDQFDAFPFDSSENTDTDLDGIGNNLDQDDDNDGVIDSNDAFPLDSTRSVAESSSGGGGGSVSLLGLSLIGLIGLARRKKA